MVGIVLRFIAWVASHVWRFEVSVINRIIAWIKANAKRVQRWLEQGVLYGTIIQWILDALGIG